MEEKMLRELKREMFDSIEKRLDEYMPGRTYSTEIASTLNFILFNEFQKDREGYNLGPKFVGEYFVDPKNPEQTRLLCHQGTEACSPLNVMRGVIGRAVTRGLDQYVPDVTKDTNHVSCDPSMEGAELVLISWSDPYPNGPYKDKPIPLGVLDLDFNMKDAFSEEDQKRLRNIWNVWGKRIFPGKAKFFPKRSTYSRALSRGHLYRPNLGLVS